LFQPPFGIFAHFKMQDGAFQKNLEKWAICLPGKSKKVKAYLSWGEWPSG